MRPEINERNIERLKAWASKNGRVVRDMGKKGYVNYRYTVDDALDELLKEVGY